MNIVKELKGMVSNVSRLVLVMILMASIQSCNNKEESKNKSTMETSNKEHITLINAFEVPEGKIEESIKYWEACRDFLKKEPGYISTKLHQSILDNARFELVNVAVWESPKAFKEASQKMAEELGVAPPEGLKANPSLYNEIRN